MLLSARIFASRTKAALQTVTDPRHRAFHAQRRILDPAVRRLLAEELAADLPHTPAGPPADVNALVQEGVVNLGKVLTPAQISEVRQHFADKLAYDLKRRHLGKFLAPQGAPVESHGAEYSHLDVVNAPHLLAIANDPRILALVETYLGATPVIAAMRVWWTLPTPTGEAEETEFFHRDMDDYRFLKLFVYLTDVDEQTGPHVYVKGSHRKNILTDLRRFSDEEVSEAAGDSPFVRFTGEAGTAFLEDTYGLHRATPPATTPRLAFQPLYTVRPIIYGPPAPLRSRTSAERGFSSYTNQIYLRD